MGESEGGDTREVGGCCNPQAVPHPVRELARTSQAGGGDVQLHVLHPSIPSLTGGLLPNTSRTVLVIMLAAMAKAQEVLR